MPLDLRFLHSAFSRPLLREAERYLADAEVSGLRCNENGTRIDGTLIRRGEQERVFVTLLPGADAAQIDCSCEADGPCVHGVALLLRASQEASDSQDSGQGVNRVAAPPLDVVYHLDDGGVWPARLVLSLFQRGHDAQLQPLALSLAWLQQQRERLSSPDWRILQRLRELDGGWENKSRHELKPAHLPALMPALLESGRCHWQDGEAPLGRSEPRQGEIRWHVRDNGQQWLDFESAGGRLYIAPEPWYVDVRNGVAGPIESGATAEALRWLERGVVVNGGEYALFMQRHGDDIVRAHLPPPEDFPVREVTAQMTPTLRFYSTRTHVIAQQSYRRPALIDAIRVSFRLDAVEGHVEFLAESPVQVQYLHRDGVLFRFSRQRASEQRWLDRLEQTIQTLTPLEHLYQGVQFTDGVLPGDLCVTSLQEWQRLLLEQVPRWRKEGWEVRIAPQFRHYFVDSRQWQVRVEREGPRIALTLSANVEGISQPLFARLLAEMAQAPERFSRDALKTGYDTVLSLGDDRRVLMPIGVLRALLKHLVELYEQPRLDRLGRLLLPASQGQRLVALAADLGTHWKDPQHLLVPLTTPVAAPLQAPLTGLQAQLRDYQWQGVGWLRQLSQRQLGGILADDMGLGKTLQTLTFLLIEKNEGRLLHPALVVAPTSVLHNWAIEASRFTPTLRCRIIHGSQRASAFDHLDDIDVCITSYALAHRDLPHWQQIPLSVLLLDEAHMIKNANTKMARALREFDAAHRFCLTGTPLENHLGELWSLFEFMMPGSLGTDAQFKRLYRVPIEKRRDQARASALLARISPHLLRRKKVDVARELPPKTEVTVRISMGEAQARYYEALHATTRQDIRRLLEESNPDARRIHILDALLRLRQACCDPRLLPDTDAHDLGSAKLDHLLDMLQSLTEEGHRVLVFSQFASMLQLISTALREHKLKHLMLTGATQDRQSLVERFQRGEVPIFLISLKAGGVGLNLTAADTVIHYDPWWNPASEEQATDRAYRIGQDKPVFVYRLICQDTLEENIVALQERKRELQQAVTETAALMGGGISDEEMAMLMDLGPGQER
jgi:superfamily II DNA or RNA helicase